MDAIGPIVRTQWSRRQRDSRRGDPVRPLDRRILPFEPAATSARPGWVGPQTAHFRATPAFELDDAVCPHHHFALVARPPEQFVVRFAGVTLHIFLEPGVVERVAAEAFELNPARVSIIPCDGVQDPQLRAAMLAVRDEQSAERGADRSAAESLANLLAVHLIRIASALRSPARRTDGALPREKLHAVIEYIDENLDTDLTLAQMAAAVHLSAYHFARQFKAATGMPPHQYAVTRRVERAQQLLRKSDLSLADVAASAGFSDQSKLCAHFKRVVGLTPRQFRKSARIA